MKTWLLLGMAGGLLLAARPGRAQTKYLTRTGRISFVASSILEDIEASNAATAAVVDLHTGQLAFAVPIHEFQFRRTLMQEHFNENYLESEKYPMATFSGHFSGADAAVLGAAGPHPVQVVGELTMHGVTHHLSVPGTLELKGGQLLAAASFQVAPADYKIEIPLLVRDNIAKIVTVRVALSCDPQRAAAAAAPLSRVPVAH